ncbi:putative holin-like toxin [Leuconostoc citreum]
MSVHDAIQLMLGFGTFIVTFIVTLIGLVVVLIKNNAKK